MCGRYRNTLSWTQLRELMVLVRPEASEAPNLEPQEDIRPTTSQWVIRRADDGLEALRMRWWLVPYFHKGKALKERKATTFNARAETVATAPTFKSAFARRRCLVPASGWDEWTGPGGSKERWTLTAKDGMPLTLAGLWDRCQTSDCGVVESFTIVHPAFGRATQRLPRPRARGDLGRGPGAMAGRRSGGGRPDRAGERRSVRR